MHPDEPGAVDSIEVQELPRAVMVVNDEDLLSRDAQASLQQIADPMGLLLAAVLIIGALGAAGQRRRVIADSVVGLLPGGAAWRRDPLTENPLVGDPLAAEGRSWPGLDTEKGA